MKKYYFSIICMIVISLLVSCAQQKINKKPDLDLENKLRPTESSDIAIEGRGDNIALFEITSEELFFSDEEELKKYEIDVKKISLARCN